MKKQTLLLLAGVSFALSGCATVLNGTNKTYTVETSQSGAQVKFTSGASCRTPCELELKRKNDQRADITLAGYKPEYVLIQSKLSGNAFGNLIGGGLVGGVVDGTNGASNKLNPSILSVRLVEVGSNEEAVLLDKDGNVISTVEAHNDKVRVDVAKTIGPKLAGLEEDFVADPEPASASEAELINGTSSSASEPN